MGAGFSKACGFPLAKELFKEVWGFLEGNEVLFDKLEKEKFFKGLKLLGERFHPGIEPYPEFEPLLIKTAVYLKDHADTNEVCDVYRILKEGTRKYLYFRLQGPVYGLSQAKTFVKRLDRTKDVIVSLNWDLVIELAFHELKGYDYVSYSSSRSGFLTLKPHGSINWRLFGQEARVINASRNLYELYPGLGIWVFPGFSDYDPSYVLQDNQLMILPGSKDEPQEAGMKKVWGEVKANLSLAGKIIFVGYSMPDYDEHTTRVFREAIYPRLQNTMDRPEVEVIDPDSNVLERYKSLFGNEIRPIMSGFEDTEYAWDMRKVGC